MKVVTGPLDVEVAQFFEGKAVVRRYMEKRGYPSVGFDIEKSQYHDANSSCGLIGMVSGCGRRREGSLTQWDAPCSTWVFMCRAQTQRSLLEPEGPRSTTRIPCVDWANQQVSRMAAMWLLLLALSCEFVLEQPNSSLMGFMARSLPFRIFWGGAGLPVALGWGPLELPRPN